MQKKNQLSYIMPAIYGLGVFLFFWKFLPHHLHFQEQFQLFLYTKSYFIETCSRPGGFSNYAGRFFTQFYISSVAGALLVSCFLTGIQLLVYAIIRRFRDHPAGLFLSFLPSLFYWYLFCDENSQTGGLIALLLTLITTLSGTFPSSRSARRIYLFASIPLLYWLAGGAVIVNVLLLTGYEWRISRDAARIDGNAVRNGNAVVQNGNDSAHIGRDAARNVSTIGMSVMAVCFALSLPFIAKFFLVQYPLSRFWWGVDYLHFTSDPPTMMAYLWLLILLITLTVSLFPNIRNANLFHSKLKIKNDGKRLNTNTKHNPPNSPGQRPFNHSIIQLLSNSIIHSPALFLIVYVVILKGAYPQNLEKEEIMAYDYYCRMKNWDKIIDMADRKTPTVPITVTCLNLALYKTGQLPEKMFHYFQNGPEGLLPTFQRDFMIPTVGGEPYWYLGFINTAQRFAFEAMEALPDYQKSVRSIKRLAETNLLNEHDEIASKYLSMLENTLFYRRWAKETRTYLHDTAKIDTHPEWGEIRRFRTETDFLFSSQEKDMMLGIFFQQHLDHRMAYEYLMAYTLLSKNIRNIPVYFRLVKDFTYQEIPKSWQEALVYIWGLENNDMETIPIPISKSVKIDVVKYANIYTSIQSPEPVLRKNFQKTYWYYLHFGDYKQTNSDTPLQY